MNKLSLNFKYTALQILYWAEASIVFVYVGFYLQAAGMSNGSVGVTIACANILSFALSNAFAELIDRKNKLTSFTASVFLLGLKILLSCSLAVLKDRNALPVAILYMFLIVFNLMSSIVYNKLYVDIEKSGNTVNFSRARGMGSLSFAVASAILGALTLLGDPRRPYAQVLSVCDPLSLRGGLPAPARGPLHYGKYPRYRFR